MKHAPLLNEQMQEEYLSVKDYLVSGERFSLLKNTSLDLLETHPRPTPEEIHKYYKSEGYISHTDSKKGALNFIYQAVKRYSLQKKVDLIDHHCPARGELLDVGAGTGDFLCVARNRGWKTEGVEINEGARELAGQKDITLYDSMSALEGRQFNVVTLWHVLEHLHDLQRSVDQISNFLKPGGTLIVAVPNYNSFDANYYGPFWAAYDVPRHLWHFSQNSMKELFKPSLSLLHTKPLFFDAFYVSLLSENYLSGKKLSFKAFWIGLRSNWKARRTNEYSSLMYIYQKRKTEN